MSKDRDYPSIVPSCPFLVNSILKRPIPVPKLMVEVARCSIGEVHGVIQVFQNCFIENPNPS